MREDDGRDEEKERRVEEWRIGMVLQSTCIGEGEEEEENREDDREGEKGRKDTRIEV